MNNFLQTFLLVVFESLGCVIFFDTFLEFRFLKKWFLFGTLLCAFIATTLVLSFLLSEYGVIKGITVILVIYLFMGICFKGSLIQKVFCSVEYYVVIITVDVIIMTIIQFSDTSQKIDTLQEPVRFVLLTIICKLIAFIGIIAINKQFKREGSINVLPETEWLKFLYFPLLTVAVMLFIVMDGIKREKYITLISLVLVVGNFIFFYIIKDIIYKERRAREYMLAQERIQNQTNMYIQINEHYQEQKLKVHEFKNNLNCIQGLLESNQSKEALNYVKNINISWIEEMNYIHTNHAIVNAVLNEKYKKARIQEIPMILSVSSLEDLPMKAEDIVTLLANLLDNAIEAADKIESGEKSIKVRIQYENTILTVSVRNPVRDPIQISDNLIATTKKEKENHGYGMVHIDRIVKKYEGKYLICCDNGYFTSTIIIKHFKIDDF